MRFWLVTDDSEGCVEKQDTSRCPLSEVTCRWPGELDVGIPFEIEEDSVKRRALVHLSLLRECQPVREARRVVRILAQDHDPHVGGGNQFESAKHTPAIR